MAWQTHGYTVLRPRPHRALSVVLPRHPWDHPCFVQISSAEVVEKSSRRADNQPTVNSTMSNQVKMMRTGLTILVAIYWLALFVATHLPHVPAALAAPGVDKWEHLIAYGTLAF